MALMRKAMDYITKLTPCVTFVPANSSGRNFVTIDSGPTCSSEVGMRGGEQLLYMNAGCFDNGLIVPVHELMHTLGFVHEHNRTLVLAGSWSVQMISMIGQIKGSEKAHWLQIKISEDIFFLCTLKVQVIFFTLSF